MSAPRDPWPDAPELAARVLVDLRAGPPPGLVAAIEGLGAPAVDFTATPVSAAVAVLGARLGVRFAHHELRRTLPVPEAARPTVPVWDRVDPSPVWIDGVLETPKYFSFFLEEPMAPYNPNHRPQWRPHELLHRVVGFGWHPRITPFECYLCARLAELLPVVHWYGLDEIGRRRCAEHRGAALFDRHCPACERAVADPYWCASWPTTPDATWVDAAERALAHLHEELDACRRELDTGRPVSTPRPRLDASSDALGYLRGHYARLSSWSFGAWVEGFLEVGVDYQGSAAALLERVEACARALVGAGPDPIPPGTPRSARVARARRVGQDVAYRALQALECLDDPALERRLDRPLDELAGALREADGREASAGESAIAAALEALRGALGGVALPGSELDAAAAVFALGYAWAPQDAGPGEGIAPGAVALASLAEGLASGLPDWSASVGDRGCGAAARAMLGAEALWSSGELRARAARAGCLDPVGALEAWLRSRPHRDAEAEDFAVLPEAHEACPGAGRLRADLTLRRVVVAGGTAEALFGWPVASRDAVPLAAVWIEGAPRVCELAPEVADLLDRLERGEAVDDGPALRAALEARLAVWFPGPPGAGAQRSDSGSPSARR